MRTVLAFVVTLALLIVVHEWGHYRAAVACNVKVLRFSVGFGRVLWSRRIGRDGCEFVVSALPLGGYVRMLDEREGLVAPDERQRAFNRKPLWQRAFVVAAGPVANLVLAVLLYAAAQVWGVQEPKAVLGTPAADSAAARAGLRAGDWVRAWSPDGLQWQDIRSMSDLRWQAMQALLESRPLHLSVSDRDGRGSRAVILQTGAELIRDVDARALNRLGLGTPYSEALLGDTVAGGPAQAAGLRRGDRVLAVDGQVVADAAALRQAIRAAPGTAMRWLVERDGGRLDIVVTPRAVEGARGAGTIGRIDATVGGPVERVTVRSGPADALVEGARRTWEVCSLTLGMIGRMLTGDAALSNLSGPLTIADVAGQSASLGLSHYLAFLALVSVSLGVLNLLPLPMLDGGHLMYYLFEAVTGRPVPEIWLERLQRGGMVLLVLLMSVALFNDVARLLGLQ
jgi:regulator of sigma E protease